MLTDRGVYMYMYVFIPCSLYVSLSSYHFAAREEGHDVTIAVFPEGGFPASVCLLQCTSPHQCTSVFPR